MRNLKVLNLYVENSSDYLIDCNTFCLNTNNENIYFINNSSLVRLETDSSPNSNVSIFPLESILEGVLSAEFLFELNVICIGTSNGDLTIVNIETEQIECVGSVPCGLKAVSWSPDQDLLALITGEDNLILMTKDFDPIVEKFLHPEDFGENKPVTAGWGSKETQFHGSEGKDSRLVKQNTVLAHYWDDRVPIISWRGDGQMLAISAIHPEKGFRQVRVWDRDAILLYTSQEVNGLEGTLSWRPSGNLIASTQRSSNKHEVVFFEKNGLRHGEFQLPFQPMDFEVKGLSWNSDSNILAIWGLNLNVGDECVKKSGCKVMLWTTSNYHWYLKLTFEFGSEEITSLIWDVMDTLVLHLYSATSGFYLRYFLWWAVDGSCGASKDGVTQENNAVMAVLDGSNVNMTPFRNVMIPPPLSAYSLCLPLPANQVVFGPPSRPNDVLLVLSDGKLTRFSYCSEDCGEARPGFSIKIGAVGGNGSKVQIKTPTLSGVQSITWDSISTKTYPIVPGNFRHWLWISSDQLLCIATSVSGENALFEIELNQQNSESVLTGKFCCTFGKPVLSMCLASNQSIAVQLIDGMVFRCHPENHELTAWNTNEKVQLQFPEPCPTISIYKIENEEHVLGLSRRHRLFCDQKELCNNCISFVIHNEFLLLTTHAHTLRCLHLKNDLQRILQGHLLELSDESPRALERGSRLVTSVTSDTRVVLQMPRGNLEVIHPRTLLLYNISSLLDRLQFVEAFQIMRKHRINLNLLYDHNPKLFLEEVETFVRQMETPANINLFLIELLEDDVSRKMYSSAYLLHSSPRQAAEITKVDTICDKLREVMEKTDEEKYFSSIITTHAKKTSPELEIALLKIKDLRDSSIDNKTKVMGALEHLLYMVDVNQMYDIALGTYDFDIVLMVAEKSQKDPKEFLPFLNNLKKLEPNYQKYKIDMHLRRYKKALAHICECGELHLEECIQLIETQKLHRDALHLFPEDSPMSKRIWQLYGEYLLSKRQLEEAGLVFQRSGHWEQALGAYTGALQWELALCAAQELSHSPTQIAHLAKNMAENLKISGRHLEAACLLEQYAEDEEEGIATLVEGQHWNTALSKIAKYRRPDLLETHFKPALLENCSTMSSNIDEMFQDFTSHTLRLSVVRECKRKTELDGVGDDNFYQHFYGDTFSETSSVTGLSQSATSNSVHSGSIATRRTSRNRQKEERKKYTLKEGSQFEDLALINALSEIIRKADDLRSICSSLLFQLTLFRLDEPASSLQKMMSALYGNIESNMSTIWPPEDVSAAKSELELGPLTTSNAIAASTQQQKIGKPLISDPSLRHPPAFKKYAEWKLFMLDK